jgi:hypothetical protein
MQVYRDTKDQEEYNKRNKIESERDIIQRIKLEKALNSRRNWEGQIKNEKDSRLSYKVNFKQDKTRDLANKFRIAESIR